MRTYVIEREIPDASKLTRSDLQAIAQKSCAVLDRLGQGIRWRQSYVTASSIFCIYEAANEQLLHQHAELGGFPADRVLPVVNVLSPDTAKGEAGTAND